MRRIPSPACVEDNLTRGRHTPSLNRIPDGIFKDRNTFFFFVYIGEIVFGDDGFRGFSVCVRESVVCLISVAIVEFTSVKILTIGEDKRSSAVDREAFYGNGFVGIQNIGFLEGEDLRSASDIDIVSFACDSSAMISEFLFGTVFDEVELSIMLLIVFIDRIDTTRGFLVFPVSAG